MTDEPTKRDTDPGPGSVFGNLPTTRPGSRSPRRDPAGGDSPDAGAAEPTPPPASAASASAPPTPPPPPPPPASAPRRPPVSTPPATRRTSGEAPAGLEEIAWASVTVAAQAATAGVKLASRALEAMRETIERS